MSIKQALRALVPQPILRQLRKFRIRLRDRKFSRMSLQETFTHIYKTNAWGGQPGLMYSGRGSAHPEIARAYVQAVTAFLATLPKEKRDVVDLGCGDFRISEQLVDHCHSYVGTDIVAELIQDLASRGYGSHVKFETLNIVSDELPPGSVCIVRQVLQHLSNEQIAHVLSKLRRYDFIVMTEHFPVDEFFVAPNVDKIHGPHIRREFGSAVCVDKPPFNVDGRQMSLLVEVPGDGTAIDRRAGVIRTYAFPGSAIPSRNA